MFYLGIEIGGTKIQMGIGPGDGSLRSRWRGPVDVAAGGDGIRKQVLAVLPALLSQARIDEPLAGVGVGFGGPVDDATRSIIRSYQIKGWDGFPLADWLEDALQLPTALGNDADVAGLAEALCGAGQGVSPIFYVTIGSGIGGGFVVDGKIFRGCGRGAAEIGHLLLDDLSVSEAGAGRRATGELEQCASGWAIERAVERELWAGRGKESLLLALVNGNWNTITARHVGEAAAQGHEFALDILHQAWSALARALGHVIALLCPRRIIIGGGVSLMGEKLLFEPLRALVAQQVFAPFADCYDIVPAALGEEVVVHGALALARQRLHQ